MSVAIEPYYQKIGYDNLHKKYLQFCDQLNDEYVKDEDIYQMEEYSESTMNWNQKMKLSKINRNTVFNVPKENKFV